MDLWRSLEFLSEGFLALPAAVEVAQGCQEVAKLAVLKVATPNPELDGSGKKRLLSFNEEYFVVQSKPAWKAMKTAATCLSSVQGSRA